MLQKLATLSAQAKIAPAGRDGLLRHLQDLLGEVLHLRLAEHLHDPVPAVSRRRNSAQRTPGSPGAIPKVEGGVDEPARPQRHHPSAPASSAGETLDKASPQRKSKTQSRVMGWGTPCH